MDTLRNQFLCLYSLIIDEIKRLPSSKQEEIFNLDIIPTDDFIYFLKKSYNELNQLITLLNRL